MSSADPESRSTEPQEAVTPTPVRRGKRRTRLELPRRAAHPRAAALALTRGPSDSEAVPIEEDEESDHELSMVSPHRVAGAGALLALLKTETESGPSDKLGSVPLPANKENLNPNLSVPRSFKRRVTNPSISASNAPSLAVTGSVPARRPLAARSSSSAIPPASTASARPNRRRSREVATEDDAAAPIDSVAPAPLLPPAKEPSPPKRQKVGSRPVVDEASAPPPTLLDVIVSTRSSQARPITVSSSLPTTPVLPTNVSRTTSSDSIYSRKSASGSPGIPSRPGAHLLSISPAPSYTVLDDFLIRSRAKFGNGGDLSTPTLGPQPSDSFARAPSFAIPQRTASGVSNAPTELLSPRWNVQDSASIHSYGLHSSSVVPNTAAHRMPNRSSKPQVLSPELLRRAKFRTVPAASLVRADVPRVLTYCFP